MVVSLSMQKSAKQIIRTYNNNHRLIRCKCRVTFRLASRSQPKGILTFRHYAAIHINSIIFYLSIYINIYMHMFEPHLKNLSHQWDQTSKKRKWKGPASATSQGNQIVIHSDAASTNRMACLASLVKEESNIMAPWFEEIHCPSPLQADGARALLSAVLVAASKGWKNLVSQYQMHEF